VAERQLTQQTLLGCVEVLAEVLSIVEPRAFSRAMRVRDSVRRLAEILEVPDAWRFEVAAMLSQIGWITLEPAIATKAAGAEALTAEEKIKFEAHPAAAARILEKIPRLETVARIIERQHSSYLSFFKPFREKDENVTLGATMLRAAIDYDRLRELNLPDEEILEQMQGRRGAYHPRVLTALARVRVQDSAAESAVLSFNDLEPGMVVYQDIIGSNGLCLLGRGQQITETMLQRLRGNPLSPRRTRRKGRRGQYAS
ncbi:MAG: two-component system response regulator, partial [Acidobacteria bacterium]|nr:two-component system response regulator [Acidobacteriota bacterium]